MIVADVAVIGAGAAAVAFLYSLNNLSAKSDQLLTVAVIDRREHWGHGRVYGPDHDSLLMNTAAEGLSIRHDDPDDFLSWLSLERSTDPADVRMAYVPRPHYGRYLKQRLEEISARGSLCIRMVDGVVADMTADALNNSPCLLLEDGTSVQARHVILAIGPTKPDDKYSLEPSTNYVADPFPVSRRLDDIPGNSSVLIIGSHLTAIDVAISLREQDHRGPLLLASRRGIMPEIKNRYSLTIPKWANAERWKELWSATGRLRLRDLLLDYRREMAEVGVRWYRFLGEQPSAETLESFRRKVEVARTQEDPIANLEFSCHLQMDEVWPLLSRRDRLLFMDHAFQRVYRRNSAAALVNAEKILAYMEAGALRVRGGLANVRATGGGPFEAEFENGDRECFEWAVNATGPCAEFSASPQGLLKNLLDRGMIVEERCGGLTIAFPGNRVINSKRETIDNLHALGHITRASHPFINNLDLITRQSAEIAATVASCCFLEHTQGDGQK